MSVRVNRARLNLFAVLITLMALLAPGAVSAQTSGSLPPLVGQWTFEPGSELKDLTGNFVDLQLQGGAGIAGGQLDLNNGSVAIANSYSGPTLTSKTLVAWVTLDGLGGGAGSPLSIERVSPHAFDAIVYGERQANRWMAGSDFFHRTQDFSASVTESAGILHQIAITYEDVGGGNVRVTGYRNGVPLGQYTESPLASWQSGDRVLFGPRHTSGGGFAGWIDAHVEEARIYAGALTQVQVQSLSFVNSPPTVAANVTAGNTVYYVDWTAANPGGGTASGVINMPGGQTVNVGFEARNANGTLGSYLGAQTGCGADYWNPTAPYVSAEVPSAPPNCELLQLEGSPGMTYRVTLSQPIVDPIMAIVSLGNGSFPGTTYDFDAPFTIVSQGTGFFGGDATRLTQESGDVLRGREAHGTIKFLGTFSTFSWTVPTPETWHGFTFAIRTTAALGNTSVQEGQLATNSGTWGDADPGDTVTLSASVGTVVRYFDGTWSWSYATTDGPAQSQSVTITANDGNGGTASAQFPITVNNVAPAVSAGADASIVEGQTLSRSGTFTDPGADAWTATVDYGTGSGAQPLALNPDKSFALSHNYPNDGSYTVTVTVNDGAPGGAGSTSFVVAVDPIQVSLPPGFPPEAAGIITSSFDALTGSVPPGDAAINTQLIAVATALNSGDFLTAETALHALNTAMGAATINGTLTIQQMAQLLTYSGTIEGVLGLGPQLPPEVLMQMTQVNTPMFLGAASLIQSLPGGFQANTGLIQPLLDAGFAITDGNFAAAESRLHQLNQAAGAAMINGTLTVQQMAELLTYSGTIEGVIGLGPQLPPEVLIQITQVNTPMFLGAASLIQSLPGGFQGNTALIQPLLDAGFAITDGNFAAAEAQLHQLNRAAGAAMISGTLTVQQMAQLLTYSGTIEGVIGLGPQLPPEVLIQMTQVNTPMFLGAASLIQGLPGGFQANTALIQPLLDAGMAITDGNFAAAETALHALNTAMGAALINGTLSIQQMVELLTYSGTIEGVIGLGPQLPPAALIQLTQTNTPAFLAAATLIQGLPGGFQGNTGLIQPLLAAGLAITDGNFASAATALNTLAQETVNRYRAGTLTLEQARSLLANALTIANALNVGLAVQGTAPTTESAVTGTPGTNGWFKIGDPVRLTLTARADLFAVVSTRYAINGGAAQAYAGPITFGDGAHTVTFYSTDLIGNAEAAKSVSFKVDQGAPTIAGSSTPANAAGWNNTDVTASFICTDEVGGSGVASCGPTPVVVSAEGTTTVTGTVADVAGNSSSASVTVKLDKSAPTVTYSGNAGVYTVDQLVSITCAATDALSGVASTTCAPVTGPAYSFVLGANSFSASATDQAGNVGTGAGAFTVRVGPDNLCALTRQFVTKDGVAHSLCVKLDHAAKQSGKGKADALRSYVNEVQAQAGKSLTTGQASILIRLANAL